MNALKLKKYIVSILTGIIILPSFVFAIGQMTQTIVVNNAIKGQVIRETLKVYGEANNDKEYGLMSEGDIKDWVQFYAMGDKNNPITSILIPKGQSVDVNAVITVSPSAANGIYTGSLSINSIISNNENTNESSINVGQKIGREVRITVTDKEIIDMEVGVIPVDYQINLGSPLQIRFQYFNKGNIDIRPEVRVQFKDIDQTKVLFTTVFPYPESEEAIKPLERKEIPMIEVPLNFSNGKYWAFVSIWEQGEQRFESKFRFQIGGGSILGSTFTAIMSGFNMWYVIIPFAVLLLFGIAVFGMKMRKKAH